MNINKNMVDTLTLCDYPVFDVHVHILGLPDLDNDLIAFAKERGMRFALSSVDTEGGDPYEPSADACIKANDKAIDLLEKHPDLGCALCFVNPLHQKESIREIRRCILEHGMFGVKLLIACRCSDERVYPVVEEAISLDVPILQHSWNRLGGNFPGESYPSDVAELARRYPEARIIMAHLGYRWKEGADAVKENANVWVDTSGFDPEVGSIEYAVSQLGVKRVLYASDAPGRDVLHQIGKILAARISSEDKHRILSLNSLELLRYRQ